MHETSLWDVCDSQRDDRGDICKSLSGKSPSSRLQEESTRDRLSCTRPTRAEDAVQFYGTIVTSAAHGILSGNLITN